MGPRDEGVPGVRVTQPGPLVAVAVDLVGQLPVAGLFLEPGPALGVGGGPREPPVPAGVGVPPALSIGVVPSLQTHHGRRLAKRSWPSSTAEPYRRGPSSVVGNASVAHAL